MRLKGEAGEDLFATFFVIALVFVFVFSANGVYGKFMEGQTQLYSARAASGVAEHIFFDNEGQLTLSQCTDINRTYNSMSNTAIRITYWKEGVENLCASGRLDVRSLSISSIPVMVTDNGKMYPGRIDAMVGV